MADAYAASNSDQFEANRELQRLAALRALPFLQPSSTALLDALTRSLAGVLKAPMACVNLRDDQRHVLVSKHGRSLTERDRPTNAALRQHLLERASDEPLVILDALRDARFTNDPFVQGPPHIRFFVSIPLVTPEDASLGSLCVYDTKPRTRFTSEEEAVLRDFTALVMHELQRHRDDTERRRLTRALLDRKMHLRFALEGAGMIAWKLDLHSTLLTIEIHGQTHVWPASETIPLHSFLPWVHVDDHAVVSQLVSTLRDHLPTDPTVDIVLRVQHPSGSKRHVAVRGRRHADGHSVLGVAFDFTEQYAASNTLRDRDEMLTRVLRGVRDAVYLQDANGTYIFVNDTAAAAIGQPVENILGRTYWELFDLDTARAFERVTARARKAADVTTIEEQWLVDGALRNFRTTLTPFPLPSGGQGILGVARDVTQERRVERALRKNNELLAQQVQERTRRLEHHLQQAQHDAFHDALTGLANRALLLDRLDHSVKLHIDRANHRFAVLTINIVRFKRIVETYGSTSGDALLLQVAHRLRREASRSNTIARMGGDEFVVVAENLCSPEEVQTFAQQLLRALTQPYKLAGRDVRVDVRMGVTVCLHEYKNAPDVLADAALALQMAREHPASPVVFYHPDHKGQVAERAQLTRDVLSALDRREFEVYFQPILDAHTNSIIAFEALARWRHPTRGVLTPDVFLEVLRETRRLAEFDRFIVNEACRHAAKWTAPTASAPSVSVNCSLEMLRSHEVTSFVQSTLLHYSLPPERLWLEVVEEAFDDVTTAVASELRALGCEVLLDNFGMGRSSLSRLSRLPVTRVKVDRSLMLNLGCDEKQGRRVLHAVVELCRTLGFQVIMEGVATPANRALVQALQVNAWQGFVHSRPMQGRYVSRLLRRGHTNT
ncbi:sensor domain-containing phosphodiesterase [Deinococcus yavapaiensis]|uniref:PAS domain S-box-containing protein/diguanylate cyclase (GGDEF)-like protein n=1 Tax=Deinococcus yavapaiensis KR-236 TaxID=694435 RepID=A0A318S560_9DEIO|nr:EAL domain-containing protein [Deinococcus yavapaiensis]PYE50953.1 PAS domain S-box-containing protein/diguanylate cyclase (GGDEF)-like protein [Deinococcus yavapaiensis KR-236]